MFNFTTIFKKKPKMHLQLSNTVQLILDIKFLILSKTLPIDELIDVLSFQFLSTTI